MVDVKLLALCWKFLVMGNYSLQPPKIFGTFGQINGLKLFKSRVLYVALVYMCVKTAVSVNKQPHEQCIYLLL